MQVTIFYGTQTGSAKKYSNKLNDALTLKNICSKVENLKHFDPDETFSTSVSDGAI